LYRLPHAAQLSTAASRRTLRQLPRLGDAPRLRQPRSSELRLLSRRVRPSPRSGAGLRNLPRERGEHRAGRTSRVPVVPRAALRREKRARGDVYDVSREPSERAARLDAGRVRQLSPPARTERHPFAARVHDLSSALDATGIARRFVPRGVRDVPRVARSAAFRPCDVHHRVSRESQGSPADGTSVYGVSRFRRLTAMGTPSGRAAIDETVDMEGLTALGNRKTRARANHFAAVALRAIARGRRRMLRRG
jgi:hypothetical protein